MLDDVAYQVTDAIRSLPPARYQVAVAAIIIELLNVYQPELPAFTTTLTAAVRSAISNTSTERQADQQLMLRVEELWESAEDQIDSSAELTPGSYSLMLVLRALTYDASNASAERAAADRLLMPFQRLPTSLGGDSSIDAYAALLVLSPSVGPADAQSLNLQMMRRCADVAHYMSDADADVSATAVHDMFF